MYRETSYLTHLSDKIVGIFGYSIESREEAEFLVKSGVDIVLGLRQVDDEWELAKRAGFQVKSLEEAVEVCDIIQVW